MTDRSARPSHLRVVWNVPPINAAEGIAMYASTTAGYSELPDLLSGTLTTQYAHPGTVVDIAITANFDLRDVAHDGLERLNPAGFLPVLHAPDGIELSGNDPVWKSSLPNADGSVRWAGTQRFYRVRFSGRHRVITFDGSGIAAHLDIITGYWGRMTYSVRGTERTLRSIAWPDEV